MCWLYKKHMGNYFISYDKFSELCYKLLDSVNESGKHYDGILCPLKGGFFLSYFMSRNLDLPVKYLEISSYKGTKRGDFLLGSLPDVPSGKYLLCDDIYDSGETSRKIISLFPNVVIDIYVLVSKDNHDNVTAGEIISNDDWVDFFWEHI